MKEPKITLRTIFNSWRYKNKDLKEKGILNNQTKVKWNLYAEGCTRGQLARRFNFIHYVLKYKIIVPLIYILKRWLGDRIIKKVPGKAYNKNLIIFDRAFEKSVIDWHVMYQREGALPNRRRTKAWWRRFAKNPDNHSAYLLRSLKELMLTFLYFDSAYREFFNIFAFNFATQMNKEYKKYKKVNHLFFAAVDTYDTDYYMLFKKIYIQSELRKIEKGETKDGKKSDKVSDRKNE